jgi:hypothetical protein
MPSFPQWLIASILILMENPKTDRAPQLADKYVLRMPDGMRDKLAALARANNRSMNAEIIGLLQQAMETRASEAPSINIESLAEEIADRVAAKLRSE